ncbi:TPA: hypothetical protein ACX6Q4_003887, partial [Photobacterium damselae]
MGLGARRGLLGYKKARSKTDRANPGNREFQNVEKMQQTLYYFSKTHVASVFDTGLEDTQMSLASLFVRFFASVVLGKF